MYIKKIKARTLYNCRLVGKLNKGQTKLENNEGYKMVPQQNVGAEEDDGNMAFTLKNNIDFDQNAVLV